MLNDIGVPPVPPRDDPPPDPKTSTAAARTPHAGDVVVNGKPVVLHPPVPDKVANDTPRAHAETKRPGHHHPRIVGEATRVDPIYAMPLEDRGSTFSITLSIVVIVVFVVLVAIVLFSVFR
jgi:hypothetical protein